jgi:hypothetical protein
VSQFYDTGGNCLLIERSHPARQAPKDLILTQLATTDVHATCPGGGSGLASSIRHHSRKPGVWFRLRAANRIRRNALIMDDETTAVLQRHCEDDKLGVSSLGYRPVVP